MRHTLFIILLLLGFQGIAQQKKTHEFDEQNRLSKVFYWNNGSVTATIIYTFDEVGNRKTKVINTTVSPQTIAISSPTSGTFTAIPWPMSHSTGRFSSL